MSTWSKQPPTEPGYYVWRIETKSHSFFGTVFPEPEGLYFECLECSGLVVQMGGEWLRLIPADEAECRVTEASERGVASAFEAVAAEREKFEAERQKWRAEVEKAYEEGKDDGWLRAFENLFPKTRAHKVVTGETEPSL